LINRPKANDGNTTSPVFIISAARSGSKLLRAILYASGDFSGRPYDINYVWKYGNYHIEHDEITPSDISEFQASKIRSFFDNVCRNDGNPRLLEKTVSNSLRIPFVRHLFPNTKIIHLYRDAHSTVNSTIMCWQDDATSDRIQTTEDRRRKLREFPFSMAWPYLVQYLKAYAKKKLLKRDYVESWGPRYQGIDEDVRKSPLPDVCAKQWARCVKKSADALKDLRPGHDYINVAYEDLLSNPEHEIGRIAEFAGIQGSEEALIYAQEVIDPDKARPDRYKDVQFSTSALETIEEGKSALRELMKKDGETANNG